MSERSRDGARLAGGEVVAPELPDAGTQSRLAALYKALAARVEASERPRVQAGDCVAALGVAAGLQRRGVDFHLVWLDAHGDFNTWETTPSGFLGGMPLAMLAGLGEQTIVQVLGAQPLAVSRILLVGARDVDPGERDNLDAAGVARVTVEDLPAQAPPPGPLYVHLDIDVVATPRDAGGQLPRRWRTWRRGGAPGARPPVRDRARGGTVCHLLGPGAGRCGAVPRHRRGPGRRPAVLTVRALAKTTAPSAKGERARWRDGAAERRRRRVERLSQDRLHQRRTPCSRYRPRPPSHRSPRVRQGPPRTGASPTESGSASTGPTQTANLDPPTEPGLARPDHGQVGASPAPRTAPISSSTGGDEREGKQGSARGPEQAQGGWTV
jgi:hypothetical protein